MFRGSAQAKIDDKGRLKMPTEFRQPLEQGQEFVDVFITSTNGESALVYPLAAWEEIEKKLAQLPSSDPRRVRFLRSANYYGQQLRLDNQGRVVIPQILRDKAQITGDVVVIGRLEILEIWNRDRLDQRLAEDPVTEEDFQSLAAHGV
jgi:MraZ protein